MEADAPKQAAKLPAKGLERTARREEARSATKRLAQKNFVNLVNL
jgi:hypothetical protein